MIGILGGAFDPPHLGHVALARGGVAHFGLERLLVRVVADPGHKRVETPVETRLALAQVAFTGLAVAEVSVEPHGRTVDALTALALDDPVFLIGADELLSFHAWKDPARLLGLARLGVGLRPGVDPGSVEAAAAALGWPDRITIFALEPHPVASTDLRDRLAGGEAPGPGLDAAVLAEIRARGAYGCTG